MMTVFRTESGSLYRIVHECVLEKLDQASYRWADTGARVDPRLPPEVGCVVWAEPLFGCGALRTSRVTSVATVEL